VHSRVLVVSGTRKGIVKEREVRDE
jgi:hypothetical protein